MGARCHAHQCPEAELDGEAAFCTWHWDVLGLRAGYQEWLYDAFGTANWKRVLAECVLMIRKLEAQQPRDDDQDDAA